MGKPLRATAAAVAPLNELLARDKSFQRVEAAGHDAEDGRRLQLRRVRRWENPRELLDPIAGAAADLICDQDFRLIRSCKGSACLLVFLDRTKAHARRWCSMAVCGNRAKAARTGPEGPRNEERGRDTHQQSVALRVVGTIDEWHVDLSKPKGGSDMGKAGLSWEMVVGNHPITAKEAHDVSF